MSLNCNEIDLILSELNLEGCFIQEIVQPNYDSIAFYAYGPEGAKTLLCCLAQGATRINETRRKITKNQKPLRFNECLKSKIKGCKIVSASQASKDRIVKIDLHRDGKLYVMPNANGGETFGEDEDFILYIRLWNNAANIILCEKDGKIIDSFYRRPGKQEISGADFVPEEKGEISQEELSKINEKFPVREWDSSVFESFNSFIDDYYSNFANSLSLSALMAQAEKWYQGHKSRQEIALEKLKAKKKSFQDAGKLKHYGDLILAFSYMIESGSTFLECEDYDSGEKVSIKIDPKKSAQENAGHYYELYKKESGGIESLEHDIALAEKNLEKLEDQWKEMCREKNPVKLEQLLRKDSAPSQKNDKKIPGLQYEVNGWKILVGRDANENDELLRHNVKGFDMWMHVRDYSGGYVFIKNRPGKTVPLEILLYAGNLAVYYSKARKNRKADLYYTQVKYLRRAKNGPKGLVLPTNEKNICIQLDDEKLRQLEMMKND